MKKFLAVFLILCLLLCVGCAKSGALTEQDAQQVALQALEVSEKDASEIHIHVTTYDNTPCYSVHVTVDGHAYEVIVHAGTGEVLHKGDSSH